MSRNDKSALIIIDVQNYFFEKDAYAYIRGSETIIKTINNLIAIFSDNNLKIVFTKQIFPKDSSNQMKRWWKRLPRGRECELFDGVVLPRRRIIIEKEYYSAFFKTNLDDLLSRSRIERLFFCGVMTHLCVETSIRDAFMCGYDCFLVEDATTSKERGFHDAAILNLSHGFCKIIRSRDINENL